MPSIKKLNDRIDKINRKLKSQAELKDVEREVAHRAFVIFDEVEHKDYIKYLYRRSSWWIFRVCQRRDMKFKKHGIEVS